MRLAVVPPEIIAAAVFLILAAGVLALVIRLSKGGAVAQDDLDEARKAERLAKKAAAAEARERKRNEKLR